MSTDIIDRMREAFRAEASELLTELDSALLSLEAEPVNSELVHRVFRAIHTIKGSGATAGFERMAAAAHGVEEAFDLARSGRLAISGELVDCGLKACDLFRGMLAAPDPEVESTAERELLEAARALLPKSSDRSYDGGPRASDSCPKGRAAFEISFRPHRDLFYSGSDPITLLDELRGLGQAHITVQSDRVPLFFDLEPESCYLWWTIRLVTDAGEAAIRDVFAFVSDECDLSVRLLDDQSSAVALLGSIPAESLDLFAVECREHLADIERHSLELEQDNGARESLDALFRAVHSIKGNAGLLLGQAGGESVAGEHALPMLTRMAHAVESALDPLRQAGAGPVARETVSLVLNARDAMEALLDNIAGATGGFAIPAHLLEQLGMAAHRQARTAPAADETAFRNTAAQCLELLGNCLRQIAEPGAGRNIIKTAQRGLKTLASAAAYQKRTDLRDPIAAQLRIIEAAMRSGEALSPESQAELAALFDSTRSRIAGAKEGPAAPAEHAATSASAPKPGTATTVRIDQEKLDRLMRVVGELLVAKGAIPTVIERISTGEDRAVIVRVLKETGAGISHIAEELQASVMAIRMLPVKTVFQRFPRLVRDLARTLGKEVQLVVEGDNVELDKTILEQIGDPLVHLIRNAVDHGLETPEERLKAGKGASGRVALRAMSQAGNVIIEVHDDGRGLNSDALKQKAIEKRLLTPEAAESMSAAEAQRLVFLPGFSTAEKVTDVSGRGVGMDVVQNNIRSLQGSVDIRSAPGEGTVFSIKLPTSLIVSKGILLEAGGQEYILPLISIRDMVKVPVEKIHSYRGINVTQVRGEVYSVFSLADMFGLSARESKEVPVAVIDTGKLRYALAADRFVSEVEVLVKPLGGGLESCKEFHGAAIMGDGRVVLVLNPLECHRLRAVGAP